MIRRLPAGESPSATSPAGKPDGSFYAVSKFRPFHSHAATSMNCKSLVPQAGITR